MSDIPVDELLIGTTLNDNLYSSDGRTLLLKKGITLTIDHLSALQSRGIDTVRVVADSDSIAAPIPQDGIQRDGIPFTFPKSLEERLFLQFEGKPILKLDDPTVKKTKQEAVDTAHKILDVSLNMLFI